MLMGKLYFFNGKQYSRYDVNTDSVDPGYPLAVAGNWPGLPAAVDAAVNWGDGKAYFFLGSQYWRYDVKTDQTDTGYPRPIAGNWPGLTLDRVGACVDWGNTKVYFFRLGQYWRYDKVEDRVDPGYPQPIAGNWHDLTLDSVDGSINWGDGKAYLFRKNQYWRYDIVDDRVDPGYPLPIAGNWPGLFPSGVRGPIMLESACPPSNGLIRLHLKVLTTPTIPIATMIDNMRQLYRTAGLRVGAASVEKLNLPALNDLNIHCPGLATTCCPFPCATPTLNPAHVSLFSNRNNVGPNEIVVYFVRSTLPGVNGCCAHPPGLPGVVATSVASPWSLAHEVGHVLGLAHVGSDPCFNCGNADDPTFAPTRLMTCCGTSLLTGVPTLAPPEIAVMNASPLRIAC
jgi:hypothetical protein